jgi:RNA polymerase sigma-70 factor (ECF subfamily)
MADGQMFAAEVYTRHGRPLMNLAVHLTGGDRHRAEDLAQETLVRAWQHRDCIRPGQERAWLAVTARHLAVDGYRRQQARQAREARYAGRAGPAEDPAGHVADAVTVRAALAALSPAHRAVIAELYYAGRTIGQTAAVLGIAPGTVKSRARSALAALRLALAVGAGTAGRDPYERSVR